MLTVLVVLGLIGCANAAKQGNGKVDLEALEFPSDPLVAERSQQQAVAECMTSQGWTYTQPPIPTGADAAALVDSRRRRESAGFGISTGGLPPDAVETAGASTGPAPSAAYATALRDCESKAVAAQDAANRRVLASLSTDQRSMLQQLETSPKVLAAWGAWRLCLAGRGFQTSAPNSTALIAELTKDYASSATTSKAAFQVHEVAVAVADWDCSQSTVNATVRKILRGEEAP